MTLLSPEQRREWETTGTLALRGVLSPERVAELRRWIEEVESWAKAGRPGMHHFEQTPAGPRVARSEDFEPHHAGLSGFLRRGLLAEVLEQLFGEPPVLFKEKINYKHPGGGGFAPHQDAPAYRFVDFHISCMVPLDPATVESGCLYFAPGHDQGTLPNIDGRIREDWVERADWRPLEVAPGDVVFFDSYAPHRSGTNRSDTSRRVMYLTYNAASLGDLREAYYADKRAEFEAAGQRGASGHVRISINDDFLGIPVENPATARNR